MQKLYQILKTMPRPPYPYCLYIDEEFGAGYTHHYTNNSDYIVFFLKIKYQADEQAIRSFLSRYKNIYLYKRLETKLLGTKKQKFLGNMPIIIYYSASSLYLNKYYDWLNYYLQHPIHNFPLLVKLNRSYRNKEIELSLEDYGYPGEKIKIYAYKNVVYINFGFNYPLHKLNSPAIAQKVKALLLNLPSASKSK